MNSHEVFIHIHQGCFACTGAIVRLPQCQWSKPDGYGKISQCITTTKHSNAKTVYIFLRIYCTLKCSNLVIHSTYWHSLVPLNRCCLFHCDDWTKAKMNSYYWLTVRESLWISFIEFPCKQGFIQLNSNLNMVMQFEHNENRNIGSTFVQWYNVFYTYIYFSISINISVVIARFFHND